VRPVSDGVAGEETTLAVVVRPPWFRARLAYVAYAVGGVAFLLATMLLARWLTRRENHDLRQKIEERTRQLAETNTRLAEMEDEAARAARARGTLSNRTR
jgi:hypothetical protein